MKSLKEQLEELGQKILRDGKADSSYASKEHEQMKHYVKTWLKQNKTEEDMAEELNAKFGIGSHMYLPQILRQIQDLDESRLNEDYDDRVALIVKDIMLGYPDGVELAKLRGAVEGSAHRIKAPELRMGDKMMKDLMADVKKALTIKGALKKAAPAPSKGTPDRPSKESIQALAMALQRYAGEAFPDGDPIDRLIPWMKKHGIRPDVSHLDKAARYLGAKSYHDYLADLYADFTADNPGEMGLDPEQNPWRESIEENEEEICPDCDGDGYQVYTGNLSKTRQCPACGGTGYVEKEGVEEGYTSRELTDYDREWLAREIPGLEGPFRHQGDGKYYYYDPKEGRWYDPTSDFYMDRDFQLESINEAAPESREELMRVISGEIELNRELTDADKEELERIRSEIYRQKPKNYHGSGYGSTLTMLGRIRDLLGEAAPESIEESNGFLDGERVRHKEQNRTGVVVGYEGDETAVVFDDEPDEAYFTPNEDLELIESVNGDSPHDAYELSEAGTQLPLEDPSRKWDLDNPKLLHIKHNPEKYEYVGVSRDDKDMMYALGHVGSSFSDNQLDNEQRHAYNKGYKYVVVENEDRNYFMQETLRRIQSLAGIRK